MKIVEVFCVFVEPGLVLCVEEMESLGHGRRVDGGLRWQLLLLSSLLVTVNMAALFKGCCHVLGGSQRELRWS